MKYPLKTAAISSIVLIALTVIASLTIFTLLMAGLKGWVVYIPSAIAVLICAVLMILYLNGFLVLAKKFLNKMLFATTFIQMVFVVLAALAILVFAGFAIAKGPEISQTLQNLLSTSGKPTNGSHDSIIVLIAFSISGLVALLFSIGIYQLAKHVKYAKVTGILGIIWASWTILYSLLNFLAVSINNETATLSILFSTMMINLLLSLVSLVYAIFQIILLFKASSDFEK
ncbi:MAG: hypothetical protein M1338_02545 [Patescibacteria group bacterium]|nr:hypothetical protein [Patescibacteria group bacterium]